MEIDSSPFTVCSIEQIIIAVIITWMCHLPLLFCMVSGFLIDQYPLLPQPGFNETETNPKSNLIKDTSKFICQVFVQEKRKPTALSSAFLFIYFNL